MGRVTLKYDCGCKAQPFVTVEPFREEYDYIVDGYDVDMSFCEAHDKAAIQQAKDEGHKR